MVKFSSTVIRGNLRNSRLTRPRKTTRRLGRTVIVWHGRRLNRAHVRPLGGFKRCPDDFTQMLASFRRAIRAYRRLAKLAPSHYDPAVVDREALAREEQRRWMASWEPALEQVYGPLTPEERAAQRHADWLAEQPRPLHPRTQRAVDRELAHYEFWKAAGKRSQARYQEFQRRRPHDLPSLGKVAQLIEIAFDFGWIASGLDWRKPDRDELTMPPIESDWEADLRRAYGGKLAECADQQAMRIACVAQAAAPGLPAVPGPCRSDGIPVSPESGAEPKHEAAPSANQPQPAAAGPPTSTVPAVPDTNAQPVPAYRRRDAWASLARHQCRLANPSFLR